METEETIRAKIESALTELFNKDPVLLQVDANERSITHQLAIYLKERFQTYDVDCEYNREGTFPKRLQSFKRTVMTDDTNATTVFPDIIIHKRNEPNNLVVIEAKKAGRDDSDDRMKLEAYKDELNYQHAFLINFPSKSKLDSTLASSCIEYI
jgi:hypothetical protein